MEYQTYSTQLGGKLTDSHRVYTRRFALGLSVKTLSAKSGISPDTIRRIERDDTTHYKVHIETALALSKALGAPLYDLFRDEELTDVGRTPKTGVAIQFGKHRDNEVCETCHLEIPLAYTTCPDCTPPRISAAVA